MISIASFFLYRFFLKATRFKTTELYKNSNRATRKFSTIKVVVVLTFFPLVKWSPVLWRSHSNICRGTFIVLCRAIKSSWEYRERLKSLIYLRPVRLKLIFCILEKISVFLLLSIYFRECNPMAFWRFSWSNIQTSMEDLRTAQGVPKLQETKICIGVQISLN